MFLLSAYPDLVRLGKKKPHRFLTAILA